MGIKLIWTGLVLSMAVEPLIHMYSLGFVGDIFMIIGLILLLLDK